MYKQKNTFQGKAIQHARFLFFLIIIVTFTFSQETYDFEIKIRPIGNPIIRQAGMADVGYSLLLDEASVRMNPALLGFNNERFENLSAQYSLEYNWFENFNLFQNDISLVTQCFEKIGGFYGGFCLFRESSRDEAKLDQSSVIALSDSSDISNDNTLYSVAFGYGRTVIKSQNFGFSLRWLHSDQRNFGNPIKENQLLITCGYAGKVINYVNTAFVVKDIALINKYSKNPFYSRVPSLK